MLAIHIQIMRVYEAIFLVLAILAVIIVSAFVHQVNIPGLYGNRNKNGSLHVYRYSSETIENRIDDLLQKMTVKEKMMMVPWKNKPSRNVRLSLRF